MCLKILLLSVQFSRNVSFIFIENFIQKKVACSFSFVNFFFFSLARREEGGDGREYLAEKLKQRTNFSYLQLPLVFQQQKSKIPQQIPAPPSVNFLPGLVFFTFLGKGNEKFEIIFFSFLFFPPPHCDLFSIS